jgi:hypothetical protein
MDKARSIVNRTEPCCMCGAEVVLQTLTSPHPEAPLMVRPLSMTVWLGVVADDDPMLIVTCGEACTQGLLAEDAPEL